MTKCWAEIENGYAIRIFRKKKAASSFQNANPSAKVRQMDRALATDQIRYQIFVRDRWTCVQGGEPITRLTGEMHERQSRGRIEQQADGEYKGGEVSVVNSETRCHKCHTVNKDGAHGKRQTRFTETQGKFSKGQQ